MPLIRLDGPVWVGTREQILASVVKSENLPPGLTEEEVIEVCVELGILLALPPEGYVWDGSEY